MANYCEGGRAISCARKARPGALRGNSALVPVTKNPATGSATIEPTTPAVPVSPRLSMLPLNLMAVPLIFTEVKSSAMAPDLPHIPLFLTSVRTPSTGLRAGITKRPLTMMSCATSSLTDCPTFSFLPFVVSGSERATGIGVPTRKMSPVTT